MNVFDLFATLKLDKSDYEEGLEESKEKASGFGKSLKNGLGSAAKIGAASVAAMGAAVTAAGASIYNSASATASYGDNIDKMSQKIGISKEAYQEWAYVAELSGTSVDNLQAGMKTLSDVIVEAGNGSEGAADKLAAVGLSIDDLNGKSQEEQLDMVVSALQGMGEGAERTSAATDLLGRSATDMAALLNMSSEATADAKQQAHDYGMIMSDEAVSASATFQDSLTKLTKTFQGAKNGIAGDFLPGLTSIMDGLSDLVVGTEGADEEIQSGVDSILASFTENLPNLIEVVGTVAESLLQAAPEIITTLGNGIVQALPELLPSVVDTIMAIVDGLIDNLPLLISCAIDLIIALAGGLIEALPELIARLPEIIDAIVVGLEDGLGDILGVGKNLVEGLWNGIGEKVEWIKEKIKGFGESVLNGLKDFFGIHSPSRKTAELGRYLAQGFGVGFDEEWGSVKSGIEADLGMDFSKNIAVSGSRSGLSGTTINMTINAAEGMNVKQLADEVADRLNRQLRQRRAVTV